MQWSSDSYQKATDLLESEGSRGKDLTTEQKVQAAQCRAAEIPGQRGKATKSSKL